MERPLWQCRLDKSNVLVGLSPASVFARIPAPIAALFYARNFPRLGIAGGEMVGDGILVRLK